MKVQLLEHQKLALEHVENMKNVAFYLDMGLGKTFLASEKAKLFNNDYILLICQKSKIDDWIEHYNTYYNYSIIDLTKSKNRKNIEAFIVETKNIVFIVNYDLVWRIEELKNLKGFTLILDESSLIKNSTSKRTKFILKLKSNNNILLSGTPCGGKYEELYTQLKLLGYKDTKKEFYNRFIELQKFKLSGFLITKIKGYKNIGILKRLMRKLGCIFMKSEEVLDLPKQNFIKIQIKNESIYKAYCKDKLAEINDVELVGDTSLKHLLNLRKLTSIYNKNKLQALKDIVESTDKRLIIFYNFNEELEKIKEVLKKVGRENLSIVNGETKDLYHYENTSDSVTLIQYQSGSMGLNLQKCDTIIYYSLTQSSELFEQSKKRIHRLGQNKPCFYYMLNVKESIDDIIFNTLEKRCDYTLQLFDKKFNK